MHFQFLIEDLSGETLIKMIMQKLQKEHPEITADYKSFHGIGGFTLRETIRETKTGKLLNDLAIYLRGFNRSLQNFPAALFVVVDNDDRNPEEFKMQMQGVAEQNQITIDHVFCLAIEEMEAWLLGDEEALLKAYPNARKSVYESYMQDSICGTWEKMADIIYPGGSKKMKKENPSYAGIGKIKNEWAQNIGKEMNLNQNASPSFNCFLSEITKRVR